jgi:isoamylase
MINHKDAKQRVTPGVEQGESYPVGATVLPGGVNFSVFSRDCTGVELLLFDGADDAWPSQAITLDPRRNRTYHYWHVYVPDISPGQLYGYRVAGPSDPRRGLRFDPDKLLIDPYCRAVAIPAGYSRGAAAAPGDNCGLAMKSVVAAPGDYDWEGDARLKRPFSQTVIYEAHVAGFTRDPSSGIPAGIRGTYAGLVKKIPYLQELGVTAIELLPVFQFDPQDAPEGLVNFWGYSPISFFAPHAGYCSCTNPLGPLNEFRDMVKALHRANIEVILDVVFTHTAEGDARGPTICYRGLANNSYYMLQADGATYADYSGCGNTLNANNPVVRRLILDSIHYWVREMHVDGFRFDLASILDRDDRGRPLENPPLLWDLETDPTLAGVKLIAEAWDAAGLYQVGTFAGDSWKEWNGRFRDDVRSFLKGDSRLVSQFASRLLASPDIYGYREREPEQSINFVSCHDGFTLNDLVSYNRKHNEANGEENRDGIDDNRSWNCGVEGNTDDPKVEALRNRQVKNFLAVTILALGVPMVLMGDEVRRSQGGNNNAYCQDNETCWFDWQLLERHADVHRFVRLLIAARLKGDVAMGNDPDLTLNKLIREAGIEWHGVRLGQPDWGDDSHSIALTARCLNGRLAFHLMINAWWEPLSFELPKLREQPGEGWHRWLDTSLSSPEDIMPWEDAPRIEGNTYELPSRSAAVVLARQRCPDPMPR